MFGLLQPTQSALRLNRQEEGTQEWHGVLFMPHEQFLVNKCLHWLRDYSGMAYSILT